MHRVVPELILENYRAGRFGGEFPAVGMFLDLSGFSRMTDALMQHGQHGAEVLASLMYGVFDPLVRSIFDYGGRIVSFAGDGIMALYPVEEGERITALRALGAAWRIQQQLSENPDRNTVYGRFSFSVKIGLAAGTVAWRILRSESGDQATYYFRGTAVDESAQAEHHAAAGEIVLTDRLNETFKDVVRTRPHGSFHRFVRFRGEMPAPFPCILPEVDVASSSVFMPENVIVHDMRGEFRQIVNLFMRIPELSDKTLGMFINVVFELRRKYGGLLTRIDFGDKGCNLLMLWGAPVAYENDIGRALNFILELQSRVEFSITAGVTYYIAHAGYLGSEMCEDYTCYGWGVNLASRFMTTAPDGEVWVDERVARRVSQAFEIEYLGSQGFKGFSAEQRVNVLRDRRQGVSVVYQGEMVGRGEELDRLTKLMEPLWQGTFAGVIGVSGDAGIGKGRLIHAFQTSPVFNEHKALWGMCQADQILQQSFNPLRKWLIHYFGIFPKEGMEKRKTVFDSRLNDLIASTPDPDLARELDRTRSILGALLDLHWEDSLYNQLDAEGRYNNTFLALTALVKAECLRQPLVLFVDDLQFIDTDSLAFLSRLKHSLSAVQDRYPVAILLAFRKQGSDLEMIANLLDADIELSGISRADLVRLVEIELGGPASPDLLEVTMSRSEGNPYFAGQIIRYLQEQDLLEMSNTGWRQIKRGRSALLPEDISALLIARLDRLAQKVKTVVQTASVLGREFEIRVLSEMLRHAPDVDECISEAEKASIWFLLREMRYIFQHALLRDAAYSMQMRARRQELHVLALGALERIHAGDVESHYAELAYHAENGDVRSKAQQYYTLAGRYAAGLYQNNQAVDYLTRALAYTPFDDVTTQFDLVAERVELFSRMGKRDLQIKDIESLGEWAKQLGDGNRLGQVLVLRAFYHHAMGQYLEAADCAQQAKSHLSSDIFPELVVRIQNLWASSLLRLGRNDEAMLQALSGLAIARSLGLRVDEGRMLTVMGLIALEQKDPSLAHQYLEESLTLARALKERRLESYAVNNLALSEGAVRGNYVLAGEYYQQAYALAKEVGDRYQEGIALTNMGFAAGLRGDLSLAFLYHEQALLVAREIGNINQEAYTLINLSAIAGINKEPDRAIDFAIQAHEISRNIHDRSAEAWAQLYMGHAYATLQKYSDARDAFNRSIDLRSELGQPSLSMEPLAGLVEVALLAGDIPSASRQVERILSYLGNGGSLDGTDEPLRVYHACYNFLEKQKDPRAWLVLQTANQVLEAQVSKFKDERSRKSFVENFPWRKAISSASKPK